MSIVGILSLAQGDLREEALRLWQLFETEYDSRGVRSFAHPNLTFQAGFCRDCRPLQDDLANLARQLQPFPLIVDGLGYFSKPAPVVYLRVRKTREIETIHKRVDEWLGRHCETRFEQYRPEQWVPHMTVAMRDLTREQFERAQRDFATHRPHFEQIISNLQLVEQRDPAGNIEIIGEALF